MVTILLSGGLGNQMFQYAAAKAVAVRLHTSLVFDTYALDKKTQTTKRNFELSVFDIDIEKRNTLKGKLLNKTYPYAQKYRKFFSVFGFYTDTLAIQYLPYIQEIKKGSVYMYGNFQNEKYFKEIESDIRRDFTFINPLTGKNFELYKKIKATNSVAVHIRRGDYLSNKNAAANFVTCDRAYYEKAIEHISRKIENPDIFIFSDDQEWVKENLNFDNHSATFVDWNKEEDSYIDMQMMSLCRHNVIANSSFSWWGAWLNPNPNKIVIAPDKWFLSEDKNKLLDDFYPKGWIKL
ncbi:MAG: alpha-1,2-fucosyltransferase [Prevotella sp.]|jgi:hypothetical protein|nr:alpha-1,2-fucosyltransferase [Prevotella sp.]